MDLTNHTTTLADMSGFGEAPPSEGGVTAAPAGSDGAPAPRKTPKFRKGNKGCDVKRGKTTWPTSKPMQRDIHETLLEARKHANFPVDAPQWDRASALIAHALKTHPYWMVFAHILYAANDETSKSSGKFGTNERNLLDNIMSHKADIKKKYGFTVYRDNGAVRALVDHEDYLDMELPRIEARVAALGNKAGEVEGIVGDHTLSEDVAKRVHKIVQVRTLLLAGKDD